MKKIQIINGPNLNLLGKREPTVYGNASFEGYLSELRAKYPQCEFAYFQSNVEGNGCMRISACIHNDPVVIEADFMDLVYHLTFHVTLKISNLTLWIIDN